MKLFHVVLIVNFISFHITIRNTLIEGKLRGTILNAYVNKSSSYFKLIKLEVSPKSPKIIGEAELFKELNSLYVSTFEFQL